MKKFIGLALVGLVITGTHFYNPVKDYVFPNVIEQTLTFANVDRNVYLSKLVAGKESKTYEVIAYSGILGDPEANLEASKARVDMIKNELVLLGVNSKNITAIGKGSTDYLPRLDNESDRAYNSRLIRFTVKIY